MSGLVYYTMRDRAGHLRSLNPLYVGSRLLPVDRQLAAHRDVLIPFMSGLVYYPRSSDKYIRRLAAENLNTEEHVLRELAYDNFEDVRCAVASRFRIPVSVQKILARDPAISVRKELAQNDDISIDVYRILKDDIDSSVVNILEDS